MSWNRKYLFIYLVIVVYLFVHLVLFFAAGHFLGNHSIIDIMRREGFAVHHMRPEQPLPKYVTYIQF